MASIKINPGLTPKQQMKELWDLHSDALFELLMNYIGSLRARLEGLTQRARGEAGEVKEPTPPKGAAIAPTLEPLLSSEVVGVAAGPRRVIAPAKPPDMLDEFVWVAAVIILGAILSWAGYLVT